MGFYSRVIVPRLCDLALDHPAVAQHRRGLLAAVTGQILEIGFGTGLNLPHFPQNVRRITVVDPNPGMHRRARRRMKQAGVEVDHRLLSSEELPFENDTFDSVVSTFTLCSIEQVDRALAEVYRVLKPTGRFLFLEHGLSPDHDVQKWQRRLNWLEQHSGQSKWLSSTWRTRRGRTAISTGDRHGSEAWAVRLFSYVPQQVTYCCRTT